MVNKETKSIIDQAKRYYAEHLQVELEAKHRNRFVAIEPVSGDYFLADTFDEAVQAAHAQYPDRLTHTIRVGHVAALHLGLMQQ